ncbi:lipocalin [Oceanihabitans sediminis]|uniref:lipocalin n=1 Tax=Oceanihabitans sediminis TaxID=1812012 RepID=UPI003A9067E1
MNKLMRNVILIVFCIFMLSCGSSKTVRDSKKVIKGDWILNSINYSETGTYNVTLFNDVSKSCFEGSNWQFIPNNNTGLYTVSKAGCTEGDRYFVFTIQEIDATTGLYNFLLKPTDKKGNSETNQGFRLKLNALSDTNMQWQQTVMVDNKPFSIIMNFTKL